MNINKAKDYFPSKGTLTTTDHEASVGYEQDFHTNTVQLIVAAQWFSKQDLKDLRKFLKLLITEIES